MSSIANSAASYGAAAFSTASQIKRAFDGDPTRVAFVRDGQVLVQFDAVLQENHSIEAGPTVFPLEDGQTVADHIILAPTELTLSGLITDSPLNDRDALFREGVVSAASAVLGPVGVVGQSAAVATARAQWGTTSPSFAAYEVLRTLTEGFPNPNSKTPAAPPTPFDVRTRLRTYTNMVIKSLQVPRDATTGNALLFNIQLAHMNLVRPQALTLALSKIPDVASIRERLDQEDNYLVEQYDAGYGRSQIVTGQAPRLP